MLANFIFMMASIHKRDNFKALFVIDFRRGSR